MKTAISIILGFPFAVLEIIILSKLVCNAIMVMACIPNSAEMFAVSMFIFIGLNTIMAIMVVLIVDFAREI